MIARLAGLKGFDANYLVTFRLSHDLSAVEYYLIIQPGQPARGIEKAALGIAGVKGVEGELNTDINLFFPAIMHPRRTSAMPNKIKLILNPTANHGRSLQQAADLRSLLANHNADWSGTEYPGHATELTRQAGEQGYDLVVAVGGDGTVHEVVNGLMQVAPESRPALGIVPLGSGNDFAHILSIPCRPGRSAAFGGQRPTAFPGCGLGA